MNFSNLKIELSCLMCENVRFIECCYCNNSMCCCIETSEVFQADLEICDSFIKKEEENKK